MDIQIVPCESVMAGKQHRGRLPGPARVEVAQQFPALKKMPREVTSSEAASAWVVATQILLMVQKSEGQPPFGWC